MKSQIAARDRAAVGQPDETFTVKVSAADMATLRFLIHFWTDKEDKATIEEYLGALVSSYVAIVGPSLRTEDEPEPKPKKARKVRP